MPIERRFLSNDITPPICFDVTDSFEVYYGQVAIVLDHLLNHIKVLKDFAEGPVAQSVVNTLSKYPHYRINTHGDYQDGATRESVLKVIIDECVVLLECLSKIASILDLDEQQRNSLLEVAQTRVPFLDYRDTANAALSGAESEE